MVIFLEQPIIRFVTSNIFLNLLRNVVNNNSNNDTVILKNNMVIFLEQPIIRFVTRGRDE